MAKPTFFFSTLFFSACLFSFYPSSGQAHLQDELSAYCAEIYKKHNRPCNLEELERFWYIQDSIIISNFQYLAKEQVENTISLADSIRFWLNKWASENHEIPDRKFDGIMEAFYMLDKKAANLYCMNNWQVRKAHERDQVEYEEVPWEKNYPFVKKLLEYNSGPELLILIAGWPASSDQEWRGVVDLVSKVLTYDFHPESEMKKQHYWAFLVAFFELNPISEEKSEYIKEKFSPAE